MKPCLKCKKPGVATNRWHLKYQHNKELKHVNAIWRNEICPVTEQEEEKELKDGTKIRRKIQSTYHMKMLITNLS